MCSNEHYKRLENMYLSAPINELHKPKISVVKKECEISMEVDSQFFHAADALHGSVYFKMLDDAAFFAANSVVKDVFVLTAGFTTKFLRPISTGKLIANGRIVKKIGNKIQARSELFDNEENLIATGKGIFVKSKILLSTIDSFKI